MKLKYGFFVIFVIFILLFSTCDFLNGDDKKPENGNNGNGEILGNVEPLLKTTWGLGAPFNNLAPMDGSTRSAAGCNAVAVAQIMNFHRHPARGSGQSEPYTATRIGVEILSVNFNVAYDWDNMLNSYRSDGSDSNEQQQNAVATLVYHAGVSVQMNYSADGSGAGSARIPLAMTTHFGYDKSILWRYRRYYDDAAWDKMLREQLDAGLPVIMAGSGHIFIVDGYDNEGRFHFNWGERGQYDGYYFTNSLITPRRTVDDPHVFINIKPDEGGVSVGYEMVLRGTFTASKTSVPQNETFTVNVNMRNISALESFPSGGHIGVVLVDNNNNIVGNIGTRSPPGLGTGNTWSTQEINCYIPETITPGQYKLRIVTRPNNGNWRLVELSEIRDGIPKAIDFTVTPKGSGALGGGYWLSLERFLVVDDKVSVSHNEPFTVSVRTRYVGTETFTGGRIGVVLVDNNGDIVGDVIGSRNWNALNPGSGYRGDTISCFVPNTIPPGQYQLRIVVMLTDEEWRIASLSRDDTPNSISFEVK